MKKISQVFILFLFSNMFIYPVFSETVLKWKGRSYDFDKASLIPNLNQVGSKASPEMIDQLAFMTIVKMICSDFKNDLYQYEGKKISESEFAPQKYPSIKKAHEEASAHFKCKVDVYHIFMEEKKKSNLSLEDFYKQHSISSDFIKCFPAQDNWKRFLMAFPSPEMAKRELEFYSIDHDTALKIYLDLTSGKLMKQEWIIRKVKITNPELLARAFPEDPEFSLKDDKRQNAASKEPQSSKPSPKGPIFLFLEESEVMRSVYADLEFENDRWRSVFEKEFRKLLNMPLYK